MQMDLQDIGFGGVDWSDLAQDRNTWRISVNMVLKLGVTRINGVSLLAEGLSAFQRGLRCEQLVKAVITSDEAHAMYRDIMTYQHSPPAQ